MTHFKNLLQETHIILRRLYSSICLQVQKKESEKSEAEASPYIPLQYPNEQDTISHPLP